MRIDINGIPAPQGSKVPRVSNSGKPYVQEQSRAVGPWREAVRAQAQEAVSQTFSPCQEAGTAAVVIIIFRLPRPASAPKRQIWPVKRPDIDKLTRAVLDGLVAGGALHDDAQVTDLRVMKRYVTHGQVPGASIEVKEL